MEIVSHIFKKNESFNQHPFTLKNILMLFSIRIDFNGETIGFSDKQVLNIKLNTAKVN